MGIAFQAAAWVTGYAVSLLERYAKRPGDRVLGARLEHASQAKRLPSLSWAGPVLLCAQGSCGLGRVAGLVRAPRYPTLVSP